MAVTRFTANDASTAKIAGGKVLPVNIIAPVISGSLGGTLSVDTGTWINGPFTYAYHWQYNGNNIPNATSNTFNSAAYLYAPISVRVIATNGDGFRGASAYLTQGGGVDPSLAFSFTYNGEPFTFGGAAFTYGAP